jgi:hypothetical protein
MTRSGGEAATTGTGQAALNPAAVTRRDSSQEPLFMIVASFGLYMAVSGHDHGSGLVREP